MVFDIGSQTFVEKTSSIEIFPEPILALMVNIDMGCFMCENCSQLVNSRADCGKFDLNLLPVSHPGGVGGRTGEIGCDPGNWLRVEELPHSSLDVISAIHKLGDQTGLVFRIKEPVM